MNEYKESSPYRKRFTPEVGHKYRNIGGGIYECVGIKEDENGGILMKSAASGWIFRAHGCNIYDDGQIDWQYSTGGYFDEGDNGTSNERMEEICEASVKMYGKENIVDKAIQTMANMVDALLDDRRGLCDTVDSAMAAVMVSLEQLQTVYDNGANVRAEKKITIELLDQRMHEWNLDHYVVSSSGMPGTCGHNDYADNYEEALEVYEERTKEYMFVELLQGIPGKFRTLRRNY